MDAVVPEVKESEEIVRNKNSTRYRRRQWEDAALDKEDGGSDAKRQRESDKPTERIKRKKMAMLLGYCGIDYYGMQRVLISPLPLKKENPGVKTIEEDLLKALLDAKYITEEDFKNQQNAQFQRSSRTDKNVSAARQVVSLKLPLEINIDEINERLPKSIRVFGLKRVTNKFNAKIQCNGRTYSYTLPTYVFEPSLVTLEERKQYRITPEKLEYVNKLLELYKGTRSFHNFTEKKHYQDPSSLRYMMSFTVDKVFVESDMEFANLSVKGQSFMLHQIRKMVGLTIAIAQGHVELSIMDKVFGKDKVMVPTAPGLGLVLDMVHYDTYNAKFKSSHEILTWEGEEEAVEKFKKGSIYPTIVKGELEENSMGTWLDTKLVKHSYDPVEDTPDEKPVEEAKEIGDDEGDDDDIPMGDDDEDDDAKLEICEDKDLIEVISNTSSSSDAASKDAGNNDSPNVEGGNGSGDLSSVIVISEDSSTNLEIVSTENSNSETPMAATNKDEDKTDQIVQVPNEASEPELAQVPYEASEPVLVQITNEALESVLVQFPYEASEPVLVQFPNEALESVLVQVPNEASEPVLVQVPNEDSEPVLVQVPNEDSEPVIVQVPDEASELVGQNGQLPKVDDQNVQSSPTDGQNDQPGSVDGENNDSGTSNGQAPSAGGQNSQSGSTNGQSGESAEDVQNGQRTTADAQN